MPWILTDIPPNFQAWCVGAFKVWVIWENKVKGKMDTYSDF